MLVYVSVIFSMKHWSGQRLVPDPVKRLKIVESK